MGGEGREVMCPVGKQDPQLFGPLSPCHACEKHSSELEDPGQRKVEAFTESLLFSS